MNTKKEETMNPDLIATCWVSAGDAAPMRGDETSPIPLAERITAIAQTGWAGIGLVTPTWCRPATPSATPSSPG